MPKNKVLLNFFQKIMGYGATHHKYKGEAVKKNVAIFISKRAEIF